MKSTFPSPVPEIPVTEIAPAAEYYQQRLGFTLDWGGEELELAGLSRGNCRVFLANQKYRKKYGNVGPMLTWLNLESREEVDELYRVWSACKAKLMSPPESKPWGMHEFTVADLDGNFSASSMTSLLLNAPMRNKPSYTDDGPAVLPWMPRVQRTAHRQ